jgi:hypothetical protein
VAKTFKVTERFNMQFRAELYNAFNHSNYYINAGNLDIEPAFDDNGNVVPNSGIPRIQAEKGNPTPITATLPLERRNVQFGLKFNF